MKALTTWDPFRELEDWAGHISSRLSRGTLGHERDAGAEWAPLVDITEDKKEYTIKAELPDVRKENVKVAVESGMLTISGERKFEHEEKDAKVHRMEMSYGSFTRAFALPEDADTSKILAEFKNGVLKVHLPKTEQAKPKQIDIKVN